MIMIGGRLVAGYTRMPFAELGTTARGAAMKMLRFAAAVLSAGLCTTTIAMNEARANMADWCAPSSLYNSSVPFECVQFTQVFCQNAAANGCTCMELDIFPPTGDPHAVAAVQCPGGDCIIVDATQDCAVSDASCVAPGVNPTSDECELLCETEVDSSNCTCSATWPLNSSVSGTCQCSLYSQGPPYPYDWWASHIADVQGVTDCVNGDPEGSNGGMICEVVW
jgi:hypothetical protein